MGTSQHVSLDAGQLDGLAAILGGRNVFVTGGAGTGKSTLLAHAVRDLAARGRSVLVCAPTGVAALNVGGMTIHSLFGFVAAGPLVADEYEPTEAVREADVVIVDEISMVRRDLMDAMAAELRAAALWRSTDEGGRRKPAQFVAFGDFAQLPPVLPSGKGVPGLRELRMLKDRYGTARRADMYAFMADGWRDLGLADQSSWIRLERVIRQQDPEFAHACNLLRLGDVRGADWINAHATIGEDSFDRGAVTLVGRRAEAACINAERLGELPGATHIYTARFEEVGGGEEDERTQEWVDAVRADPRQWPCDRTLGLKVGALVMCLANDVAAGYANGTLGTVTSLGEASVTVRLESGMEVEVGEMAWPIYSFWPSRLPDGKTKVGRHVVARIHGIPLRLAAAVTIHKSQGSTISRMNLVPASWDPGQLYVALSRAEDVSGLHIASPISRAMTEGSAPSSQVRALLGASV